MRRLATLLVLCLCWTCTASAWLHPGGTLAPPPARIQFNISTYGGVCNGSADDTAAFSAANDAIIAAQGSGPYLATQLNIDVGTTCMFLSADSRTGRSIILAGNAKDLIISGYGKALDDGSHGYFVGTSVNSIGNPGLETDDNHLAEVASVSAGASTVTVNTPGEESRFTAGHYAILTGGSLQAGGNPPNPFVYEYLIVASVNTTAHTVTFTTPLQYSYKSTWPIYRSQQFDGGPATLYAFDDGFNGKVEYQGITFSNTNGGVTGITSTAAREQVYRDTTDSTYASGHCGIWPSEVLSITFINHTSPCSMEFDKMVGTMTATNSTWFQIGFFSSGKSTTLHITGGTVIGDMNGTPYVTNCSDSTITSLEIGPKSFGGSQSLTATNCVLGGNIQVAFSGANATTAGYSVSSSNILWTDGSEPFQWCMPGQSGTFGGQAHYQGSFSVTDVTKSGSPSVSACHTNIPGSAFPTQPLQGGTDLFIRNDPMPVLNFSGVTGTDEAVDLSQAGAQNAPIWTYSSRTYTCPANMVNVPNSLNINDTSGGNPNIWGTPGTTTLTVTVTRADTNGTVPSPRTWEVAGQFGASYVKLSGSTSQGAYDPKIDLTVAAPRTVTMGFSGTTGGGGLDNFTDMSDVLVFGGTVKPFGAGVVDNAATCPVATVTWQTTR